MKLYHVNNLDLRDNAADLNAVSSSTTVQSEESKSPTFLGLPLAVSLPLVICIGLPVCFLLTCAFCAVIRGCKRRSKLRRRIQPFGLKHNTHHQHQNNGKNHNYNQNSRNFPLKHLKQHRVREATTSDGHSTDYDQRSRREKFPRPIDSISANMAAGNGNFYNRQEILSSASDSNSGQQNLIQHPIVNPQNRVIQTLSLGNKKPLSIEKSNPRQQSSGNSSFEQGPREHMLQSKRPHKRDKKKNRKKKSKKNAEK